MDAGVAPPSSRRRRGSVIKLAGTTYLGTVLGFITGPVLARSLGPSGRGEIAAVVSYQSLFGVLLAFGMTLSITHALLALKLDAGVVLGVVLRFSALALIPSAVAAWVIAQFVLTDYSTVARIAAAVFIVLTPLSVLQLCQTSFLIAEGALGPLAWIRFLPLGFSAAFVVVLGVAGQLTLFTYLLLTLVTTLLTTAVTTRAVRVRPRRGGRLGPQIRFGLKGYVGSLAGFANFRLDQVLIAPVLGPRDLGFYAIAVTVSNLPLGLSQAVSARTTSNIGLPEGGLDVTAASEALRTSTALGALSAAAVAALAPVLVPGLYGADFGPVVLPCVVLMVGAVALGIGTVAGPMLSVGGRPGANSISQLVALVVTVVGLLVLLPALGVVGAAITSSLAYWVRALLQLRTLSQLGVRHMAPGRKDIVRVIALVRDRATAPIAAGRRRIATMRG